MHAPRQGARRARSFDGTALAGFAAVILLLTLGMAFAIRSIEQVTDRHRLQVQAEAYEIALVERLRWSGELLVSVGRGYLISGTPEQLRNLRAAQDDFDDAVSALEDRDLSPAGTSLIDEVARAAASFRETQDRLLRARRPDTLDAVVERFETELLPARMELRGALERLVGHKTATGEESYAEAEAQRARLMGWTYGLLGALVIGCVGVAWYAARRLARMYRREADARDTAHRALRARDELTGIMAHDLRSPLGAITIRADLLRDGATDDHTRAQAGSISNIASRMALLIKSMLDVTVIEAGQLPVHQERCDVDGLVREVVDMFSTLAASKRIALEARVPERGLSVQADRGRILQVLSNLLENAIKFTPREGHVTLSAERTGEDATFAVSDTGPGIAEDHLPHVFDRYWKHYARSTKGTGLGLFIAKSIVDAHGGRLWAESPPGRGATFRFTLRRGAPEEAAAPEDPARPRPCPERPRRGAPWQIC